MKLIKTIEAAGHVLCHDITRIVYGEGKGPAFRKGHIVKEEDIKVLLDLGKEHLYIWENTDGMVHENDAAEILCQICRGSNIERSDVKEGKIELRSSIDGLFKVDRKVLHKINSMGQLIISARHGNFPVRAGDILACVRIVPLLIEEAKMEAAGELSAGNPILNVLPFKQKKAGVIVTGGEVFSGRINDTFTPALKEKLSKYGVDIVSTVTVNDEQEKITNACLEMINHGRDLIICTGGMSVDPDDRTPLAIRKTGADVISYGTPVLPGSMFMLAYYKGPDGEIPIVGLPGCVMYVKISVFDLILPRIIADDLVSCEDISLLGHGGLCLNCENCAFPNCGFGKG